MSLNPRDHRPPYIQIAEAIKEAMDSGDLPAGERLPSIRQMEKQYGVAQQTIQHALRLLREEGRIISWQGRGTFVIEPEKQPAHGQGEDSPEYQEILDQLSQLEATLRQMQKRMSELEATVNRLERA